MLCCSAAQVSGQEKIDFGRDIAPILSDTCFKCHGPDEHDRKGDLRLDTREGLFESSVVPNDLEASELYHRVFSEDSDLLMPPQDSGRKLTDAQKKLFKDWIEQGATWQNHWSLIAPTKPAVPSFSPTDIRASDPINEIDKFIVERLNENGWDLAVPAQRLTLIRRVAFDLTGLPPTPELVERYRSQPENSNWYEELVDELLCSHQYGEHMARYWLDAARYGDTHGLHLDNYREMWPYRDWVVKAFIDNRSYRDFVIEQLAGDLLEDPTDEQLIASGFNRAHITTNEGGAITEEVYVRNVVDRVSTTGTVFLGMTVGCAQCHDHKFDPISQREFYQLFAYFNNLTDAPMDNNAKDPAPVLKVMTDEQRVEFAKLESLFNQSDADYNSKVASYEYVEPPVAAVDQKKESDEPVEFVWVDDETLPAGAIKEQKWEFVSADKGPVNTGVTSRLAKTEQGMIQHLFTGALVPLKAQKGDRLFAFVYLDPEDTPEQIMLQFNDGSWDHRVYWGASKIEWGKDKSPSRYHAGELPEAGEWVRLEVEAEKVGFINLTNINGMAFTQWNGKAYWDSAGIVSKTDQSSKFKSLSKWTAMIRQTKGEGLPEPIKSIATKPEDKTDENDQRKLLEYFVANIHSDASKQFVEPRRIRDEAKTQLDSFNAKIPTTLVSNENKEIKQAFLLERGEYDQKGEPVERATPAAFPPFDSGLPNNRLGFAKWLTSGEHPLTARVAVNRFWQQVFGTGLVKTSEDFGAQGDAPSHPELLDWLATDFVEHDWDIRRLMKQFVMSATYRQHSFADGRRIELDPDNRLLARGPRFRLDAEMLRDQALAISGLLVPTMGGPGVKPPQPDGLWFAVGYSGSNTVRFKKDAGAEKVHRRSLYTFWKRTAPPPQMNTFDAPSREECSVRRERTNTPLQALLLMNDPQYVEAARYLAQLALSEFEAKTEGSATDRVRTVCGSMMLRALGRNATTAELNLLKRAYEKDLAEFKEDADAAKNLIAIGETPADTKQFDATRLATWTMVANLIMNMDEFVTKN